MIDKPVPNSRKGHETRAAVLIAAARCFRAKGYAAVSLREIAKSAGLTTGSLYYHFDSKEAIVGEVLDQGHIHLRRAVEEALNDPAIEGQHSTIIRRALKTHILCLFGGDSLPSANIKIFSQVPDEVKAMSMASRHEYEDLWLGHLTRAQQAGWMKPGLDPELVMPLVFGAINWTIEWADPGRDGVDDIVEQVTIMLKA